MDQPKPRVVVSAIIERVVDGQKQIFVQTRYKPQSSPTYLNTLEIPAGGIDSYENVFEALKREIYEETGLKIVSIGGEEYNKIFENRTGDKSMAFRPYLCQQVTETNGGLPWYGFVFICQVEGQIKMQDSEAKDPRWLSIEELEDFLKEKPKEVFSLQYATLLKYVEENK
jgi:8-oxo-dGTP pyrophosphatase MutT (NUDIX family)